MDPGPRFEEQIKTAHQYECGICDLRYVEEEKLRKHKKSHQKGKVKEESLPIQQFTTNMTWPGACLFSYCILTI